MTASKSLALDVTLGPHGLAPAAGEAQQDSVSVSVEGLGVLALKGQLTPCRIGRDAERRMVGAGKLVHSR